MKFVDLFCGSGGLSIGLERANFNCELAIDFDSSCIETFKFNHPKLDDFQVINEDISKSSWKSYTHLKNDLDLLCGGPPCQGFSTANRQRLINDPRNMLYKDFIKSVNFFKPKAVLMENVSGIFNKKNQIISDFNSIGYDGICLKINVKDYNIPQNRVRVLFIMFNKKYFKNDITHCISIFLDKLNTYKSIHNFKLKDAIEHLPKLSAKNIKNNTDFESEDFGYTITKNLSSGINNYISLINKSNKPFHLIYNHKSRYNNERDIQIFSLLNEGEDSSSEKISHLNPYKNRNHIFKDKYYKLVSDKISKTITAHMKFDCNMYIHPSQSRGLTPREAARIQSYPDYFLFKGPFTKWYMQIGNSVPPLLSFYLGQSFKKVIYG